MRKSLEEEAKNVALHEKSLLEEIKPLKSQLAAKEKERVETVNTLHVIETRCISMEAKLEGKTEEFENLKKDYEKIEREKKYLKRWKLKRIKVFMRNAIACGSFVGIVMINLARRQKMLVGS